MVSILESILTIVLDVFFVLIFLGIIYIIYTMLKESLFPKKQDNTTTITFQINIKQPNKDKEVKDK